MTGARNRFLQVVNASAAFCLLLQCGGAWVLAGHFRQPCLGVQTTFFSVQKHPWVAHGIQAWKFCSVLHIVEKDYSQKKKKKKKSQKETELFPSPLNTYSIPTALDDAFFMLTAGLSKLLAALRASWYFGLASSYFPVSSKTLQWCCIL